MLTSPSGTKKGPTLLKSPTNRALPSPNEAVLEFLSCTGYGKFHTMASYGGCSWGDNNVEICGHSVPNRLVASTPWYTRTCCVRSNACRLSFALPYFASKLARESSEVAVMRALPPCAKFWRAIDLENEKSPSPRTKMRPRKSTPKGTWEFIARRCERADSALVYQKVKIWPIGADRLPSKIRIYDYRRSKACCLALQRSCKRLPLASS